MMSHSFDGIREILFLWFLFDLLVESDQNILFSCVMEDSHFLKKCNYIQAAEHIFILFPVF